MGPGVNGSCSGWRWSQLAVSGSFLSFVLVLVLVFGGRGSLLLMHACALFMHSAVINYAS